MQFKCSHVLYSKWSRTFAYMLDRAKIQYCMCKCVLGNMVTSKSINIYRVYQSQLRPTAHQCDISSGLSSLDVMEWGKRGTWAQSGTASPERLLHFSARLCSQRLPLRAAVAPAQYQCPAGCWQFPLTRGSGHSKGLRFPTPFHRSWSPASDVNQTVLQDNKASKHIKGKSYKTHFSRSSICCVKPLNTVFAF